MCGPNTETVVTPTTTNAMPMIWRPGRDSCTPNRPDFARTTEKTMVRAANGAMSESGVIAKAMRSMTVAFPTRNTKPRAQRQRLYSGSVSSTSALRFMSKSPIDEEMQPRMTRETPNFHSDGSVGVCASGDGAIGSSPSRMMPMRNCADQQNKK